MSRDVKRKKLQRRRERDFLQKKLSQDYEKPKASEPRKVILFSYDVTYEPLRDPLSERVHRAEGEDAMEELHSQITVKPLLAIPRLNALVEKYPDVPMLYNWLQAAYQFSGNYKKADEIGRLNFARNPDYAFALIGECVRLLNEGNVERVTEILNKRFDLKVMYPHRNVFHVSEVMAFSHMMVQYYTKIGEIKSAELLVPVMERLDPENPMVTSARITILRATGFASFNPFKKLLAKSNANLAESNKAT